MQVPEPYVPLEKKGLCLSPCDAFCTTMDVDGPEQMAILALEVLVFLLIEVELALSLPCEVGEISETIWLLDVPFFIFGPLLLKLLHLLCRNFGRH